MTKIERKAIKAPWRVCVKEKCGLQVGIPPKLRGYRDKIFDFVPKSKEMQTVVEIGTLQGWFAWRIMKWMPNACVFSIDPFEDDGPIDGEYNYKCWKKNLREWWGKRAFVKRGQPGQVAEAWPKQQNVDWLWVDGLHGEFAGIALLAILNMWTPFMKHGGLISGHDIDGEYSREIEGALKQFCEARKIPQVNINEAFSLTGRKTTACWWFYWTGE